jgi:site-specific DNA-methyltransferase (adenine-specific)
MKFELLNGDCLEVLKTLESNSVDSLVTDPPAGISFMGKEWDSDKGGRDGWIKWMAEVMTECKRVMKPGAHGLVWAIPRTSHWTATALEDAGFEIRDVVTHLFGQGFPKSLNIEKAGAGSKWSGWGTALKPASEHWILVRKPCEEKTVAANVQRWGTGGINIDESRIATDELRGKVYNNSNTGWKCSSAPSIQYGSENGRFPANLVLSHSEHCTDNQCDIECAIKALDGQSGILKTGNGPTKRSGLGFHGAEGNINKEPRPSNQGCASRFFYCAKISTSERNAGLEDMPDKVSNIGDERPSGNMNQRIHGKDKRNDVIAKNNHPTVKPQKLMSYFVRMITPPGGVVLDPFMGSGSTGMAARATGFGFIGIERDPGYFEIAQKRING